MIERATDVMDSDPHHEDTHEQVQKDSELDREGDLAVR